jgi:hypothetical protein
MLIIRLIIFIAITLIGYGCCTTETITKTEQVPYVPKAIQDTVAFLASELRLTSNELWVCDSLLQTALTFQAGDTTMQGDVWKVISTAEKRIDSLKNVVRYYRKLILDVQPHRDSTLFVYTSSQVRPWTLWEKVRLAGFVPVLILWLGSVLILVLLFKFGK